MVGFKVAALLYSSSSSSSSSSPGAYNGFPWVPVNCSSCRGSWEHKGCLRSGQNGTGSFRLQWKLTVLGVTQCKAHNQLEVVLNDFLWLSLMHGSVHDAPLPLRVVCMNFGWICMLMGGVFCGVLLSVCKTQGLVRLTLNA